MTNLEYKKDGKSTSKLKSVEVPAHLEPIFEEAEIIVSHYFENLQRDPQKASITVGNERYILVRASSLSTEFTELVTGLYKERGEIEANNVARDLLFDLAHTLGKNDAKQFHSALNIDDPVEKLAVGPVHFAYTGWAFVKVLPESNPSPDDSFFLSYEHPHSFEADTWIKEGKSPISPVCIMNAGYSSGWCEASFGVKLVSVELECRALGHDQCRFIMAPPEKIEKIVNKIAGENSNALNHSTIPQIPEFFQRKRLEEELQKERDFIKRVLDTAHTLICVLNNEGIVVKFNHQCEKTTGYKASEMLGTPVWEKLILPEDREKIKAVFTEMVQEKCTNSNENIWVSKDNERRMISWTNAPIIGAKGIVEFVIATGQDITEKRQMETQLLQAQKLESIGRLAAGVAHEINTPAQFVGDNNRFLSDSMGNLVEVLNAFEKLFDACKDGEVNKELVDEVDRTLEDADLDYLKKEIPLALSQSIEGLNRVIEIVAAMKEFSHSGGNDRSHCDINKIITNALTISRSEWRYLAEMETDMDPSVPSFPCYPGELGQVFVNIVVNGAHAVESTLDPAGSQKGLIRVSTKLIEDRVCIRISDNGPGIPEEIKELIFDPFFTTKEVGKGTGQGLAICRSVIVEKHNGSISIETPEEGGTTFVISIPIETN